MGAGPHGGPVTEQQDLRDAVSDRIIGTLSGYQTAGAAGGVAGVVFDSMDAATYNTGAGFSFNARRVLAARF